MLVLNPVAIIMPHPKLRAYKYVRLHGKIELRMGLRLIR